MPSSGASLHGAGLALLDDAERDRAARFRTERDRVWFVSHRALVRRVLARYLGIAPAAVRIRLGSHGKPEIGPASPFSFNASRSGGLSVVAVALGPVGVDVERLRPVDDALELADALFTERERRLLRAVVDGSRATSFMAMWTRKESVVKAFGVGLSVPLDAFDVTEQARRDAGRWHGQLDGAPFVVAPFAAPSGWIGAVTLTGSQLAVRQMDPSVSLP
jgi:4'-phosphopantetheinyl transferase